MVYRNEILGVKDHLHIRGDHQPLNHHRLAWQGSSPHTWRSHKRKKSVRLQVRIISTYVEITHTRDKIRYFFQDHLHIRGDHSLHH